MAQVDKSMTKEQGWYQIGMECVGARRAGMTRHEANWRVGQEHGCTGDAVGHRERYAKAIDRIRGIAPDGAEALLTGKIALTIDKVILLSKKQPKAIKRAMECLTNSNVTFTDVFPEYSGKAKRTNTTVKDAPVYDPDAQVIGLIYTIPSWIDSLERLGSADLSTVSAANFEKLIQTISELKSRAERLIARITEGAQ